MVPNLGGARSLKSLSIEKHAYTRPKLQKKNVFLCGGVKGLLYMFSRLGY